MGKEEEICKRRSAEEEGHVGTRRLIGKETDMELLRRTERDAIILSMRNSDRKVDVQAVAIEEEG